MNLMQEKKIHSSKPFASAGTENDALPTGSETTAAPAGPEAVPADTGTCQKDVRNCPTDTGICTETAESDAGQAPLSSELDKRRNDIEKALRKKFKRDLIGRFEKAVVQYELVQEGDRIAVAGVSILTEGRVVTLWKE